MKVLDLFSGIGGFSLGLERAGMETIAFCEVEPFCQQILNKHWPDVPVFPDIRELSASDLPEQPRLICGGYPCQPFSVAGLRRGKKDDRHLWPEMFRLIQECRPDWVVCENVSGHIRLGLDEVLSDLESESYTCQPFVVPACAVNAPHRRDRVWIIANKNSELIWLTEKQRRQGSAKSGDNGSNRAMANTNSEFPQATTHTRGSGKKTDDLRQEQKTAMHSAGTGGSCLRSEMGRELSDSEKEALGNSQSQRVQGQRSSGEQVTHPHDKEGLPLRPGERGRSASWDVEPSVGRVVDGFPGRVDRLKSLGNAVVPQIPEVIGRIILEIDVMITQLSTFEPGVHE